MWKTRIAGDPLFTMRKEIELVKWACDRTSRADWDKVISNEDMRDHWSVLEKMREKIKVPDFNTGKPRKRVAPTIWAAVDACTSSGRGVMFFDQKGVVVNEAWIGNTETEKQDYAFILETRVILEMLQSCDLRKRKTIGCVSDCVPAILCVTKGYSRNGRACDIIP